MAGTAMVHRPTEYKALKKKAPLPPAEVVADRLIVARATEDRYGAQLFDNLLDRIMGDVR